MTQRMTRFSGVRFITDYNDQSKEPVEGSTDLVIPADLTELSDEDLAALQEQAAAAFQEIYQDGQADYTDEDLAALSALTEGIERLNAEAGTREASAEERRAAAAELAARVTPPAPEEAPGEDEDGAEPEEGEVVEEAPAEEPEAVTAGAVEVRISTSRLRSRQPRRAPSPPAASGTFAHAAPDVPGFTNGQALDLAGIGEAFASRLNGVNAQAYAAAASAGRHMRTQTGVAVIRRNIPTELVASSQDPTVVDEVMARAVDQSRLPGNSLVAAGGWCAPSEVLYDQMEVESRDGIISLPEIGVNRGGIRYSVGPDFVDLYAAAVGFHYTEAQDVAGTYGIDETTGLGDGSVGTKPCIRVPCEEFLEARLEVDGICITGGLLQQRAWPESIARYVRGSLTAHAHRIAGRVLDAMKVGSTAVAMPADQVGAVAPLLTAIDLQVEHYRTIRRMSRASVLEIVLPFWVLGALRADLARRLGVDLISVPDARIIGWFRERNVNPQFVYNFQDVTSGTAWPATAQFLLYAAGTWVRGSDDIITLDAVSDSTLRANNDFTALFTEEAYLVAKRGHDSRIVTVPICANGATAGGVAIDCDGSTGAAA